MLLLALPAVRADEQPRLGEFIAVNPPQPAPETAFTDIDGKSASLADFKGRPAIVNLWATWCAPCVHEMPSLDHLQAKLAGRLTVAAVAEDRGGVDKIKPFVAKMELSSIKIYLDPKTELERAFHARGLPTSIVLDADGRVVGKVEGAADWGSDKMLSALKPLLEKAADAVKKAER